MLLLQHTPNKKVTSNRHRRHLPANNTQTKKSQQIHSTCKQVWVTSSNVVHLVARRTRARARAAHTHPSAVLLLVHDHYGGPKNDKSHSRKIRHSRATNNRRTNAMTNCERRTANGERRTANGERRTAKARNTGKQTSERQQLTKETRTNEEQEERRTFPNQQSRRHDTSLKEHTLYIL